VNSLVLVVVLLDHMEAPEAQGVGGAGDGRDVPDVVEALHHGDHVEAPLRGHPAHPLHPVLGEEVVLQGQLGDPAAGDRAGGHLELAREGEPAVRGGVGGGQVPSRPGAGSRGRPRRGGRGAPAGGVWGRVSHRSASAFLMTEAGFRGGMRFFFLNVSAFRFAQSSRT